MDWKRRFDKQPAERFDLPFDSVLVSEDKKSVRLMKKGTPVEYMSIHQFLKFLDSIEQEGLNFDRAGLEKLVGISDAETSPA